MCIIEHVCTFLSQPTLSQHSNPPYGKLSKFHVCFCGLDSGNLKFETVRTDRQHICFWDLRRSI